MGGVGSGNEMESSDSHRLLIDGMFMLRLLRGLILKRREMRDKPSKARIGYRRAM
jgi:hypothetical protein